MGHDKKKNNPKPESQKNVKESIVLPGQGTNGTPKK